MCLGWLSPDSRVCCWRLAEHNLKDICQSAPVAEGTVCPLQSVQDRSQEAIGFLEAAGLNLSGVVQLGGHTKKRTHHNLAGPNVGTAIMRALHTQQAATPSIKLVTSAQVRGLPPQLGSWGGGLRLTQGL